MSFFPHRPLRLALIPAVMMALVACGAPATPGSRWRWSTY